MDKVRDVVGIYMNPPEHAVVLCVDEKIKHPGVWIALQPSLPMRPGQVERRTHDYRRHGVIDLFAALNVATGHVIAQTCPEAPLSGSASSLDLIDVNVPDDLAVHVVLDNASTHKTPAIHRWLLTHPRSRFRWRPAARPRPGRTLDYGSPRSSNGQLTATSKISPRISPRRVAPAGTRTPGPSSGTETADQIDSLRKYLTNVARRTLGALTDRNRR